jgi:hypothetical protein
MAAGNDSILIFSLRSKINRSTVLHTKLKNPGSGAVKSIFNSTRFPIYLFTPDVFIASKSESVNGDKQNT